MTFSLSPLMISAVLALSHGPLTTGHVTGAERDIETGELVEKKVLFEKNPVIFDWNVALAACIITSGKFNMFSHDNKPRVIYRPCEMALRGDTVEYSTSITVPNRVWEEKGVAGSFRAICRDSTLVYLFGEYEWLTQLEIQDKMMSRFLEMPRKEGQTRYINELVYFDRLPVDCAFRPVPGDAREITFRMRARNPKSELPPGFLTLPVVYPLGNYSQFVDQKLVP